MAASVRLQGSAGCHFSEEAQLSLILGDAASFKRQMRCGPLAVQPGRGSGLGCQVHYSQLLAQEERSCLAALVLRTARGMFLPLQSVKGLQDAWPCQMVGFSDNLALRRKRPSWEVVSLLTKWPWTRVRFAKANISPARCQSWPEPFLLPSWSLTAPFPGTAGGLRAQPG